MAGNRRERRRSGHPRAVTPKHRGREAVHAQALQAMGSAAGAGVRQARILCGSQGETRVRRRAPSPQGDQQRGRSIASPYPPTREGHGRVQVAATDPEVLVAHDQTAAIFRPRRHRLSARSYRHARQNIFDLWADYTSGLSARAGASETLAVHTEQPDNPLTTHRIAEGRSLPDLLGSAISQSGAKHMSIPRLPHRNRYQLFR